MDIFTIRIAGNVAGKSQIASIEYGLKKVKTPVLVVLGHTDCGAVKAAEKAEQSGEELSGSLKTLLQPLFPAVKRAREKKPEENQPNILQLITEENVWLVIRNIFQKSELTRQLVKDGKVKVVGAIYNIETGKIDWLSESKPLKILKNIKPKGENDE
jgi:carbonic anhydrase